MLEDTLTEGGDYLVFWVQMNSSRTDRGLTGGIFSTRLKWWIVETSLYIQEHALSKETPAVSDSTADSWQKGKMIPLRFWDYRHLSYRGHMVERNYCIIHS